MHIHGQTLIEEHSMQIRGSKVSFLSFFFFFPLRYPGPVSVFGLSSVINESACLMFPSSEKPSSAWFTKALEYFLE